MRIRSSLIRVFIPVLMFAFILSCENNVPLNELSDARTAIEEAKVFDAGNYAPDEMKKAETLQLQSHDFLMAGKTDDAKKAAKDSYTAAIEAQTKSLPKYAAEQIKKTDSAYAEADLAYAEKFSYEKFTGAGKLNAESKSLYEKKDYKKSAGTSLKAYTLAVEAKNESLKSTSVVENEVGSAENRYTTLKNNKFSSFAEGNLTTAGTSITNAKEALKKGDNKTALLLMDVVKKELDAADEIIRKQQIYASIQSLRAEMKEIQGKNNTDDVKQDLDNALLELNGAETALEQNNLTDAGIKAGQAEKLIKGSDSKLKKRNAYSAIDKSEKLLVQARGKDTGNKFKDNLDKAGTVLGQSRTSADAGNYNEALSGAEEAETIINAVLNSIDSSAADVAVKSGKDEHAEGDTAKDQAETSGEKTAVEESKTVEESKEEIKPEKKEAHPRTYTVQWRKKNTDCLWRISSKVYKDASYWPAIYLANRDQIKDPDLIFPGQKFIIPPKPHKKPSFKKEKVKEKEKSK